MSISPKALKISGIVLIALGAAFCICLIAYQYLHCVDMWSHESKAGEFASAPEYFFAVSTGAILIAVLGGGLCAIAGTALLKKASKK